MTYDEMLDAIKSLPTKTLWRHNQAGDLAGDNNSIDTKALRSLVDANKGKKGFTYTHKPMVGNNLRAVRSANRRGFTINLSANNFEDADRLKQTQAGPVVTLLPSGFGDDGIRQTRTPQGFRVVQCPATYRDDVNCFSCGLCAVSHDARAIVGFPGHGSGKSKSDKVFYENEPTGGCYAEYGPISWFWRKLKGTFAFNAKSSNSKTGPIPVTTSHMETCPDNCPLKGLKRRG